MQSFPQPPSVQEEKEYMRRFRLGDREARNLLIERNLRLVAYIARKYSAKEHDMDDLISIGTIGLIKAVDSFDEKKGIRLVSYASRCIENELLMYMRTTKKTARDVYLYDSIGADKEGNEVNLIDVIEYEDEDVAERLTREQNLEVLGGFMKKVLTERERAVICLRYGLDGNGERAQREVAKRFHISRSYVSRIEKKALGKLRNCYDKIQ
jgi:RNA polymerase sporulation-specific sigma factor